MNRKGKIIFIILIIIISIEKSLIIIGAINYNSLLKYSLYAGREVYKRTVANEDAGFTYDVNADGSYKLVKRETPIERSEN